MGQRSMSIRLDQADFDELVGILLAELSMIDGTIGMAKTVIAQLEEFVSIQEQKRRAQRKYLNHLRALRAKDPDHTPLPVKTPVRSAEPPPLTRPKNSRPPPPRSVRPLPLPTKKR
jgi:hypothetical protein